MFLNQIEPQCYFLILLQIATLSRVSRLEDTIDLMPPLHINSKCIQLLILRLLRSILRKEFSEGSVDKVSLNLVLSEHLRQIEAGNLLILIEEEQPWELMPLKIQN